MIFPILLGLVGCGILLGLGTWQLQRLAWKEALLAQIEGKIHLAPVALPAAPTADHDRYLAVTVDGAFTGQNALVLASTGDGPGVRVIATFETHDGRRILVDRGLLPEDQQRRTFAAEPGHVIGNLDWPRDSDAYTPPPDAKTGLWFARNVPGISAALHTEPVLIVASGPSGDGIAAQPVDTSSIPNDHWNYAMTWFGLALAWAGMSVYLMVRTQQRRV